MKSRKTSYSLSKLNPKKPSYHQNSERSLKKQKEKKTNLSQIQNLDTKNQNQSQYHQAVYNEYYHTDLQRFKPTQEQIQSIKNNSIKRIDRFVSQIEQKMKKVMQSQQYQSDVNFGDIVMQQQEVDEDFEQKIMINKQLLKMRREKKNNSQSHQNLHKQVRVKSNQKKLKKKLSLIQNKIEKPVPKLKSRSMFPPINSFSSKLLNLVGQQKIQKNRLNNENDKLNKISNHNFEDYLKKDNIYIDDYQKRDQIKKKDKQQALQRNIKQQGSPQNKQQIISRNKQEIEPRDKQQIVFQRKQQNSNEYNMENKFKRKFTQFSKQKPSKKITQLKLQSKIEDLKNRLAQRTSAKQPKSNISPQIKSQTVQNNFPRYSSNSVFDSIQQFLSNPHQSKSKSKRKFLKLYEKMTQSSKSQQKQKQLIIEKIKKIKSKIQAFEIQQDLLEKDLIQQQTKQANIQVFNAQISIRNKDQLGEIQELRNNEKQNKQIYKIQPRSTNTSPSPFQSLESDYGALQWRRLQKDDVKKSDFDRQLKYVISLQQKGGQILKKYVENKKILHELKMLKKSQELMNKKVKPKDQIPIKEDYCSL